ncbi:hypothetical protein [Rhabdaerophilum sp. SD176]|jgi:hypothetical protein|uniref:hypothetical protein n=1 Tax=Rhabdaerophilum sp. SD176 TaxID=2983548 RepID=UPI0024DFBE32|nr:hypothetical protein [Rhabdaerophilum sp. SD176]
MALDVRFRSILASALVALALPLGVATIPRAATPLLLIAPPWRGEAEAMQILATADARLLARGRFDGTLLVAADGPDLVRRLYAAGAFLVLNGDLYTGCTP